jgi:membrane protease subunit (stomatin/prohibitin family)
MKVKGGVVMQYFGLVGTPDANLSPEDMQKMATMGAAINFMGSYMNTDSNIPAAGMGAMMQPAAAAPEEWVCECGCRCTGGSFCTNCGTKRPMPDTPWNCTCGMTGLTTKYCTNCGKKRG